MSFRTRPLLILIGLLASGHLWGQSVKSRVIDEKTQEIIPYATVQFGENSGVITNEEGSFSLLLADTSRATDSIFISCLGYEKKGFSLVQGLDSVLQMKPKAIELSEIYLFDNELTVDEIIEKVKERLASNYNDTPTKQQLFFRQSSLNNLRKFDIQFEKSTIKELDKDLIDSVVSILPKGSSYYTESLCDFYRTPEEDKLYIEKAAELYDKNNEGSMEALSKKMEKIFRDNVKSNSYLKIKSGMFGTKVQVDSILEASEEAAEIEEEFKEDEESHFLSNKKHQLNDLYSGIFYEEDSPLNFLEKSGRYKFHLKGYTAIQDEGVYIIQFAPKRSEDFRGTAYINIEDFAIVRLEYANVNSLKRVRLLGFHYEETVYRGTTIFEKGPNKKYNLRFMEKVVGKLMGVDRPLKVIEKNKHVKGRRKQNELSLNLDIVNQNTEKYELVVFDSNSISTPEFSKVEENEAIKATYLSKYDPEFWEGYTIMEPNKAIREFTVGQE